MTKIIPFTPKPPPEPKEELIDVSQLAWVCTCGCGTHWHYANGDVVCGHCEKTFVPDGIDVANGGHWLERLPPVPAVLDTPDIVISRMNPMADVREFMEKQIAEAKALGDDVQFAVMIRKDLTVTYRAGDGDPALLVEGLENALSAARTFLKHRDRSQDPI